MLRRVGAGLGIPICRIDHLSGYQPIQCADYMSFVSARSSAGPSLFLTMGASPISHDLKLKAGRSTVSATFDAGQVADNSNRAGSGLGPSPLSDYVVQMKKILTIVCFLLLAALAAQAQVANQHLTISPNGKYFYNSITGEPVFITGEDGFLLSLELASDADVNTYLSTRASQGFNAVWLGLTDRFDQNTAPDDALGNAPFTGAWFVGPNAAYWAHQDSVIQLAQSYGITVFLHPSFIGDKDGSSYDAPEWASSSVA